MNTDYSNTIYHIESDKTIKLSSIINIFEKRNIDFTAVTEDIFNKKLSANYSIGMEYIKSFLCENSNKYQKDTTLEILDKLDFQWSNISKDYFENIVNISLKLIP